MKKKKNIVNIFIFVVIVYFVSTFTSQQITINKYKTQIEMYNQDIYAKESLLNYYLENKDNVNTDEYIENIARKNLGLVKPYEKIFIDVNK
jgi:cell division protein FtsB